MPTYNFRHKDTNEEQQVVMRISELDEWKANNPEWIQFLTCAPMTVTQVGSTLSRTSDGWNDVLNKVKSGSGQKNTINVK
jgi:hypothetical protein